jgi:hypothetical protein
LELLIIVENLPLALNNLDVQIPFKLESLQIISVIKKVIKISQTQSQCQIISANSNPFWAQGALARHFFLQIQVIYKDITFKINHNTLQTKIIIITFKNGVNHAGIYLPSLSLAVTKSSTWAKTFTNEQLPRTLG